MGGSPQPAKTYSPQEQAQAQMQLDNAAAERTARAAEAERQRVALERQNKIAQTQGQVQNAFSQGQNYGTQRASSMGFADNYGVMDAYNSALNSARMGVPEDAGNVNSYFDYENLWNKATNQAQQTQQTKLDNQFRNMTPIGWQREAFADTADDSILEAILGEQYGTAFDTIDAARARGQISQGAFDNSLRGLDTKKLSARSTLEDLGLGVLGGYRDELTGVRDQFNNQITNYKLGQNFNLDDFTNSIDERKQSLGGRMKGDIYRAVGDTNLFNTDSIINKGSSQAGVSNNPLRNAFLAPGNNNSNTPERTTGTTGVF